MRLIDPPDLETAERLSGVLPESVKAKRTIEQSPFCDDPSVPMGTPGMIVDRDYLDSHLYVDFGAPYGVVLCDYAELRPA